MNLPRFERTNNPRFIDSAFDKAERSKLIRGAMLRRNVYLILFLSGIGGVIVASLTRQFMLSVMALFLSTLSLVVLSKYDTQLCFLRILNEKKAREEREDLERSEDMMENEAAPTES